MLFIDPEGRPEKCKGSCAVALESRRTPPPAWTQTCSCEERTCTYDADTEHITVRDGAGKSLGTTQCYPAAPAEKVDWTTKVRVAYDTTIKPGQRGKKVLLEYDQHCPIPAATVSLHLAKEFRQVHPRRRHLTRRTEQLAEALALDGHRVLPLLGAELSAADAVERCDEAMMTAR